MDHRGSCPEGIHRITGTHIVREVSKMQVPAPPRVGRRSYYLSKLVVLGPS